MYNTVNSAAVKAALTGAAWLQVKGVEAWAGHTASALRQGDMTLAKGCFGSLKSEVQAIVGLEQALEEIPGACQTEAQVVAFVAALEQVAAEQATIVAKKERDAFFAS